MTWIAPDNIHLSAVTGFWGGLGLNPVSINSLLFCVLSALC